MLGFYCIKSATKKIYSYSDYYLDMYFKYLILSVNVLAYVQLKIIQINDSEFKYY